MIDKDKHGIDDGGFIVPIKQQQVTEGKNKDLFENLKKITPEEIGNIGEEMYYSGIMKKLEKGYQGKPLDLDLAVYLLNHKKVKLLVKNFGKFDEAKHREIILKFIEFLGKKESIYQDDKDHLMSICKKVDKGIAILLINNRLGSLITHESDSKRIRAEGLDMDIVNKLKEKDYSLGNLKLDEFIEKDRKFVALEIIKAGGEPDLSLIIKEDLTQGFALDIININTEHAYKILSKNIKLFDEITQKELVLKYIKGGYWKYVDSNRTSSIYCKETAIALIEEGIHFDITKFVGLDIDIVNKLKEKGFDLKDLKLDNFREICRKDVSLEIIKAGGKPDFSLIPKEYLTKDFASEIMKIETEDSRKLLAENIELFDELTQKILAIKYIEGGYRTYVDAMWPKEIINCKEIAISLIDKGQENELKFRFVCLDADVINILKVKKYDFKKLSEYLACFIEEDRKDAALEMIKAGGEPDLSLIPKKDLTKDFASEIIGMKQDAGLKALSLAVPFFETSLINGVVTDLVNAGGWKYIKNEVLKTNRFDKCLDKGFMLLLLKTVGAKEAGTVLKKFSNLDSEVASIFIKSRELGILSANLESFNNLNSKIAKSLINGGYKSAVKKNMERFNMDDETLNLLGNTKDNSNIQRKTGRRRGKVKSLIGSLIGPKKEYKEKSEETLKILQELQNFRKEWEDHEDLATDDIREKIVNAADKIQVNIDIDPDGNKIFKLKLKNRTLQILIPRLENYTDERYEDELDFSPDYRSAFDFNNKLHKSYVKLGGMKGNDVKEWDNHKLKTYVLKKESEGYKIPSKKDMIDILSELGESAGLDIDDERKDVEYKGTPILTTMQMLLLMYLTGSPGSYWLSDIEESSDGQQERLLMTISRFYACFEKMSRDNRSAGILMIK